jgi:nitric oxide reductase NorQ protein
LDLTFVPNAGQDKEYDETLERALAAIRATKASFNEDEVRYSVAVMVAQKRGLTLEEAFGPKVDLDEGAEEEELSFDKLTEVAAQGNDEFWEDPQVTSFLNLWFEGHQKGALIGAVVSKGPSGCGKTEGFTRSAARFGVPSFTWNCGIVTSPEKWLGRKGINEDGTYYEKSEFIMHLEGIERAPGLIILDEINRVPPSMANMLMSLLDGRKEIYVPETGETVRVHPEVMFAATMNEGNGFGGTFPLDDALSERLTYVIPRDFPPEDDEVRVMVKRTGITEEKARKMVFVATKSRNMWRQDELRRPISTRLILAWARLVATGMPISKAADFSILSQYRPEEVGMVKQILQGKVGGK